MSATAPSARAAELVNPNHAARQSALRAEELAIDEACTAAVNALNNQIRATYKAAADAKERAAAAVAAAADAADERLAVDALALLEPHARAYADAPRSTARALAADWRALNDRAVSELGVPISPHHLALAFAYAAGVADKFGHVDSFHHDRSHYAADVAEEASRAILGGAHDALADGAIRELEIAVVEQAQNTPHADAERAKAKHSRATLAGMQVQERAVDAARAAARAAETAGTVAPNTRFW